MAEHDVFIRYLELPHCVHAVTIPNDDGTFDVYVNSLVCPQKQKNAVTHELRHIKRNHFYDENPVILNEKDAG